MRVVDMDNRKGYVIGTLVIIIGIILLIVGSNMVKIGREVESRYETIGGRILRILSYEDRENYKAAKESIVVGERLEAIGAIILVIGVAIILFRRRR